MIPANTHLDHLRQNRRTFLNHSAVGLGTIALASLASDENKLLGSEAGRISTPPFQPKAKRVIYLFMSGAPSQLDMWDYKPKMNDWYDKDLPDSIRNNTGGQRIIWGGNPIRQ